MGLTERALRELMRILETGKFPSDDSAASDLYFVVREALENRRTLSDRTAERDQLRILYNTARDGMREVGELLETCRIELAESRAEVERLQGESEVWRDGLKLSGEIFDRVTAEREAATTRATTAEAQLAHWKKQHDIELLTADGLADTAAGLRRALEDELSWSRANGPCQAGLVKRCMCPHCITERSKAALAASPDDHERRIKAEGLREVARAASVAPGAKHWEWDGLYNFIISEADRLEKEATNGR